MEEKEITMTNEQLVQENETLKEEINFLVDELRKCRNDIAAQIAFVNTTKKDMRRLEVQLNSLKAENASFKSKFSRIESNPVGKFALKVYRWLRELKRRRG